MAALTRLAAAALRGNPRLLRVNVASISTSSRKKDTVVVTDVVTERAKTKTEDADVAHKNWVSWGFSQTNIVEDNTLMHATFFVSITFAMVFVGYIWAYLPDFKMRSWSQREAFLELRRRESLGLPLIDSELVPLERIELPSDEELGDTEIII